ncbi:MAG TPA: hypothetical protein VNM91_05350 [Dehalococcoidia bacterium]|nr:hypothetical protein [Dehalococcoidia bacterium]
MAEVFAGFIIGYALSLIIAPAVTIGMVRMRPDSVLIQRIAPGGTNVVALMMVVHGGLLLLLTMLGLILGMALGGIEDRRPAGGLGSPNLVYTLLVIALTFVLVIPTLAIPAVRRYSVPAAVVFAALFGWGVPWLAAQA